MYGKLRLLAAARGLVKNLGSSTGCRLAVPPLIYCRFFSSSSFVRALSWLGTGAGAAVEGWAMRCVRVT
jgi:hypothetical protein